MRRLFKVSQHGLTMPKLTLFPFALCLCVSASTAYAQWNLTGDNYTTQRLSIGTTSFSDKLSIEGTAKWQIRLRDTNAAGVIWQIGASGSDWAAGTGKFVISNSDAS